MAEKVRKIETLGDLRKAVAGIPESCDEFDVLIMTESATGFGLKELILFPKDHQLWITVDEEEEWSSAEDEDDDCTPTCSLPAPRCQNRFCYNGMTSAGPCLLCNKITSQESIPEKPKIDICEVIGRGKVRRA